MSMYDFLPLTLISYFFPAYCMKPTKNPTNIPTKNPTRIPTSPPTSKPTVSRLYCFDIDIDLE